MLYAIIIGINEYKDDRIKNLQSARTDALAFSNLLAESILENEREIITLLDQEATKTEIFKAIGELLPKKIGRDDLITVYFAGHGSPEQNSPTEYPHRFLIAHDTDYEAIFSTGISLSSELNAFFERLYISKNTICLIDACFSGIAGGRGVFGPALERRLGQYRQHKVSLKALDMGYGKAIITACRDDQVAYEDRNGGIFTKNLLSVVKSPGSPTIGVGELYELTRSKVMEETAGAQRPMFSGWGIDGMSFPRLSPQTKKAL